jgi:hypothetical protein
MKAMSDSRASKKPRALPLTLAGGKSLLTVWLLVVVPPAELGRLRAGDPGPGSQGSQAAGRQDHRQTVGDGRLPALFRRLSTYSLV